MYVFYFKKTSKMFDDIIKYCIVIFFTVNDELRT